MLWLKQILEEYGIVQDIFIAYCDNTSVINISKNLVQHSRTKPIDIRHHFICDLVESKTISLKYIKIENQLLDFFTKALKASRFDSLGKALGIGSMQSCSTTYVYVIHNSHVFLHDMFFI